VPLPWYFAAVVIAKQQQTKKIICISKQFLRDTYELLTHNNFWIPPDFKSQHEW